MLRVLSSSQQLQQQVENEDEWTWARNEANLGGMTVSQTKLEQAMTSFSRDFLLQDFIAFKKAHTKESLAVEFPKFS